MMKLDKEEVLLPGFLKVVKGTHTDEAGQEVIRLKVDRPDASAILLYNTDTSKFVLTRQHRYAVGQDKNLELIAGKVDSGETPKQAAVRELLEEVGYTLDESDLTHIVSINPSPGYTNEIIHIFAATVTAVNKTAEGGGLAIEHEEIEIEEFTALELLNMIQTGELKDAKTICAITIQALKLSL